MGASGLVVPVSVVFAALEGLAALSAQLSPAEAAAAARSIAGLLVNSGEEEEALQSACLEVLQMVLLLPFSVSPSTSSSLSPCGRGQRA